MFSCIHFKKSMNHEWCTVIYVHVNTMLAQVSLFSCKHILYPPPHKRSLGVYIGITLSVFHPSVDTIHPIDFFTTAWNSLLCFSWKWFSFGVSISTVTLPNRHYLFNAKYVLFESVLWIFSLLFQMHIYFSDYTS